MPNYLKNPVPSPRTHLYGIRSGNDLPSKKYNENAYSNSFYPHAIKNWNEIGPELRQS